MHRSGHGAAAEFPSELGHTTAAQTVPLGPFKGTLVGSMATTAMATAASVTNVKSSVFNELFFCKRCIVNRKEKKKKRFSFVRTKMAILYLFVWLLCDTILLIDCYIGLTPTIKSHLIVLLCLTQLFVAMPFLSFPCSNSRDVLLRIRRLGRDK